MNDVQKIDHYLRRLGLKSEVVRIYLELARSHSPSVLGLAKKSGASRTQIYRHLETLQSYNLVSVERVAHGLHYKALPIENVESILDERIADLEDMRRKTNDMGQLVHQIIAAGNQQTVTQHYYGLAGVKQANWNLTHANKEYRVFEAASLLRHVDKTFAERCQTRLTEQGLLSYDLTNSQSVSMDDLVGCDLARVNYCYINPDILTINYEMYLYNGMVTLLDYSPEHMQAIEIRHPAVHDMLQQMFEIIWGIGKPLQLTEDGMRL